MTGSRPRIVSLVPSLTETLLHFGIGDRLVGRTRYCVEPADQVERSEAVGGTKNPDIERIVALAPDLVVVNKEENRIEDWQALVDAGLEVMVTHPRTVADAADMIEELGRRAGAADPGQKLAAECRDALAQATRERTGGEKLRTFCPIWRNPWMTFLRTTYIGDVLETVGLENIFGDDAKGGDFFEVDVDEALARNPEIIVLPDEPYVFSRKHGEELRTHGAKAQIFYVDGKDLCWYGPRIARSLARLLKITDVISRI
jgi:ABC-type Fe3+-hydroxamate transport system substrate-binding protein